MLEVCIQTSYDQSVQLIFKSFLPVVYGTPLNVFESKKSKDPKQDNQNPPMDIEMNGIWKNVS